ncbi:MAG TPA: UbiA family prenyltransferase [Streptosporangiaceae bacterium]|nr:UbiA family prenyltransferase [Streptosporangiaceae bacterium]
MAGGLFRLAKIKVFQHYFGLTLAWLMLSPGALHRPGTTPAMSLFLLGSAAIVACACSADDIAGFRNGSDAINYRAGERLRDIRAKPLLSGAVSERQAVVFSVAAGAIAVAAGLAAFWQLRWQAPVAAYVLYLAGFIVSVQYSAGLKISYRPGGAEVLLCLTTAAGLLAPFVAVNRGWSPPAVVAALLLGLWLVMVSSCSNVNDAAGDRMAGRRTLAVAASQTALTAAMVAFFVVSVGLVFVLTVSDARWPPWTPLAVLPAIAAHARQLAAGPGRGHWLEARRLGLIAYNLGFLGIAAPAYLAFH